MIPISNPFTSCALRDGSFCQCACLLTAMLIRIGSVEAQQSLFPQKVGQPHFAVSLPYTFQVRYEYFFRQSGDQDLWDRYTGYLSAGNGVRVAQVEVGLPDPALFGPSKTFTFLPGSTPGGDNHANTVGTILYSSGYWQDGFVGFPDSLSAGVGNIHAFTTTQFRTNVLAVTTDGNTRTGPLPSWHGAAIDVLNISNAMGGGNQPNTVRGLDYLIDAANVLACTAQPGSSSVNETCSGVLWNSLVVGLTAPDDSNADGTQYENINNVHRRKPDITAASGWGHEGGASSYATPTVASGAAMLLERARVTPGTHQATNNFVLKSIIMTGASKTGLFSAVYSNEQVIAFDYSSAYVWSNFPPTVPLDRVLGVGNFNINNSYGILEMGEGTLGATNASTRWVRGRNVNQSTGAQRYYFSITSPPPEFSAVLVWNRHIQDVGGTSYSFSVADLHLELFSAITSQRLADSDDPGNNVEHIYLAGGLPVGTYYLQVSSHSNFNEDYGLAWRTSPAVPGNVLRMKLVATNAVWKYFDRGSEPGPNWAQLGYDDASWDSGPARLGYGGEGEVTTVSFGPDPVNRYVTTYYRRTFVVPPITSITNLLFRLQREDGAVVRLNGQEVYRSIMSPGPVNYSTPASDYSGESQGQIRHETSIPVANLPVGTNLVAVEVHSWNTSRTDAGFSLELIGSYPLLLTIRRSAGQIELAWPASVTGWRVYSAPAVTAPSAVWIPLSNIPIVADGLNVISLSPTSATQFYRLGKP